MKNIIYLSIATLLQGTALGILIPILTHYVLSFGATSQTAPLIFSTFSSFAFFSAFMWGRISDHLGRRIVLLIAGTGTALSYIWLANATHLWELYASRALAGIMAGWAVSAFAYVADVTDTKNRAKGMGIIGAFFGAGFVVGPALSAILVSGEAYYMAAYGALVVSVMSLVLVYAVVPEPKTHTVQKPLSISTLFGIVRVRIVLGTAFFVALIFTSIEGSYALYLYKLNNVSASEIGIILLCAGIANIVMQGLFTPMLVKRLGEMRVLQMSVIVKMLSLYMIVYVDIFGTISPLVMLGIGMGLYFPSINALGSKVVPDSLKGSISGSIQSTQSLARIIGPAFAGWAIFNYSLSLPYQIGLLVCIFPLMLLWYLRRIDKV